MTRTITLFMICAGALLPVAASAQQADSAYCAALATQYQRYVGDSAAAHRGQQRDATVDTAITQCSTNSATAIPVIEKALKNARIDLPPRG
ncbi:MAG: hypothetical protein J0J01_05410 [Reyranella sp.]|uniref:hypothetical protein n=1 Tax=Reyranella sp. TaxID=1929291 RepID=UPI001AD415B3|nr:hypothetical protein [Reyranella sp.]MBN9086324.1 hypothetical protein [Reyranella sp.]